MTVNDCKKGYAVSDSDGIDVNTVSETRRGAIVCWLCVKSDFFIRLSTTDDQVEEIWLKCRGNAEVIPVYIHVLD